MATQPRREPVRKPKSKKGVSMFDLWLAAGARAAVRISTLAIRLGSRRKKRSPATRPRRRRSREGPIS
jgi:hypothetical protein